MRNIWFTIYSSPKDDDKYEGITNYRTLIELLLIPAIQNKLNRDKKVQKYMLMFSNNIESDDIKLFKDLHYEKKVEDGIVNLYVSTKTINWNNLLEQERKDFLIEKWKVLFSNLSDDYFVTDKSEVITSLEELKNKNWKITSSPFKRKVKYNKENYAVVLDVTTNRAQLALVRDSDGKWFKLKDYDTWKIMTDVNFKGFQLEGDTLTFVYKNFFNTMFESPVVFDLKEIIK
ncbi:hypothetical protein CRN76_09350 [Chryseobacterium indologenes]|uniref:hypothetical protein n=1 Tax=Chryseobacterium TaxID=59732 RepID=UPI0004895227|nr:MULTISPECIES: hypothetical protein [Chryseobacterium]ATN05592.1 hypothetical protein CRN76_09350 [Chryseobacterium indologenes]AYY85647.1 hypothetical protein EGX91_14380 [Chryseobacterium indologenes]QIX82548.1 hypothetical protein FOB56_15440 [Chryseobacterium indologenes]UDQ52197.1 hypothetical protein LJF28_12210 [Chryseobacterium indologenes]